MLKEVALPGIAELTFYFLHYADAGIPTHV